MSADQMKEKPAWLTDETIIPPYPILRCPRCKKMFDDYSIHICADLNRSSTESASTQTKGE